MDAPPRQPYPSDLSDTEWAILEPMLPPPFSVGAPRKTDFREVVDAIEYVLRTGCAWSALPHDFPPEGTVRDYFHQWRRSGLWQRIHDALRSRVRQAAGKESEPSAGSIDSQTVKATRTSGQRGYDAGKKNQRRQAAHLGGHLGVAAGSGRPSGEHPRPWRGQTRLHQGPTHRPVAEDGTGLGRRWLCGKADQLGRLLLSVGLGDRQAQ